MAKSIAILYNTQKKTNNSHTKASQYSICALKYDGLIHLLLCIKWIGNWAVRSVGSSFKSFIWFGRVILVIFFVCVSVCLWKWLKSKRGQSGVAALNRQCVFRDFRIESFTKYRIRISRAIIKSNQTNKKWNKRKTIETTPIKK